MLGFSILAQILLAIKIDPFSSSIKLNKIMDARLGIDKISFLFFGMFL